MIIHHQCKVYQTRSDVNFFYNTFKKHVFSRNFQGFVMPVYVVTPKKILLFLIFLGTPKNMFVVPFR